MAQGELYTAPARRGRWRLKQPVVYDKASCGGGEGDEHTMVPDVPVISTKVLNKLSDSSGRRYMRRR